MLRRKGFSNDKGKPEFMHCTTGCMIKVVLKSDQKLTQKPKRLRRTLYKLPRRGFPTITKNLSSYMVQLVV